MKARTKAILEAAEIISLDDGWYRRGICNCISGGCASGGDKNVYWFEEWFRPNSAHAFWIGAFNEKNLRLRYTFIAMAAAVSETEE